jgi:PKD repeat protein
VQFTSEVDDGTPPLTYDWDFGDGKPHGRVANPVHVYGSEGEFTAVLRVTDSRGLMGEEEYEILVERETLVRRKAVRSRRTGFGERR